MDIDWSEFSRIGDHRTPCRCGWRSWHIVKQKNRGGTWQYRYQCQHCGYLVPKYLKKSAVESAGIDAVTIGIYGERPLCEVCGHDGAQEHHWAPQAIFGEESERWPKSYLCQKCHTRWHQLVTPTISHRSPQY